MITTVLHTKYDDIHIFDTDRLFFFLFAGNAEKNIEYNWNSGIKQFPYEKIENIYNTEELYFDESVPKKVLGYAGDTVSLRCVIYNLGTKPVHK